MKGRSLRAMIAAAVVVVVGGGYLWIFGGGKVSGNDGADVLAEQEGPVAQVKTVPIKKGVITENVSITGTVVPTPDALQIVSVPFECRVRHVLVSEGQEVSLGENLLEIEPSPDTYLELEKARGGYEFTKESLRQMQQRFDLKLATNDQLQQAKQAFEEARLSLESMNKRGIDGPRKITTDAAGLSAKVHAQEGAIVPAGSPLVEIVVQNHLEVRLGIEPEDIDRVKPGRPVFLVRTNAPDSSAVTGQIRKISRSVNATTRLVDVFVTLPPSSQFLLGENVFGTIPTGSREGLVVPRSAVLPAEEQNVLFTVLDGRAVKHAVQIVLENEKEIEVSGTDLQVGQPVVTLGNYELDDGMAVKAENG